MVKHVRHNKWENAMTTMGCFPHARIFRPINSVLIVLLLLFGGVGCYLVGFRSKA